MTCRELPEPRAHWLDLKAGELNEEEKEKMYHYDTTIAFLDADKNNKITKKEIKSMFSSKGKSQYGIVCIGIS